MSKHTEKWQTMFYQGYQSPVAQGDRYNGRAHGGVCLRQAKVGKKGVILGRLVNSTGGSDRTETGPAFRLSPEKWAEWQRLARGEFGCFEA